MSHIPELRYGTAGGPYSTDTSGRAPLESSKYDPSGYAPGVPVGAMRSFSIAPLTLQNNNIAASQTPTVAGKLTLTTAGTGITYSTITIGGVAINVLDITGGVWARGIQVTGGSGTTAQTVTVTGYDEYNQLTTNAFTGPAGATTVYSTKAWRYISSITIGAGTTGIIEVGTADIFGFPIAVFTWDQLINSFFNATGLTSSSGFTAADTTSPATSATNHVRGMYQLQSSSSNGTRLYTAYIHESEINAQNMNTAYGVIPA